MPETSNVAKGLRERLGGTNEERLGRALSDMLENPLFTGALGRASDAREKAVQAQEVALGALNLPSAADIERLTRRLRSVSLRLEGIEDSVQRLDRALSPDRVEARLAAIEQQLAALIGKLGQGPKPPAAQAAAPAARRSARSARAAPGAADGSSRADTPAAAKRQPGKAKRKRA